MAGLIDSVHHIELDGVAYKLAQDAQGQHHVVSGEPLRPPNSVTIQGESQQKFQPRPDILLWRIDDWSAGEGFNKVDFGRPGRSKQLQACRVFEEPGHLIPGFYVAVGATPGPDTAVQKSLALVTGIDKLYGLDTASNAVYTWNDSTERWGSTTLSGPSVGSQNNAAGDTDAIYWIERGTTTVWKWTGSGVATSISTGLIDANTNYITQLGAYVYVYRPRSGKVWEIPKSGAAGVEIDDFGETSEIPLGLSPITTLDGRVYALVSQRNRTAIREIVPTSAAGTGYGSEIARFEGFAGDAIWSHSGTLYILGRFQETTTTRAIMYLSPGGQYGSLGEIREGQSLLQGSGGAQRMLDHFWVQRRGGTDYSNHTVFQVDATSGAIAAVAYDGIGYATGMNVMSVVAHRGNIFWSTSDTASYKLQMWADMDSYATEAWATSPAHDFDLGSVKYLGTLSLTCEPLPSDWTVYVDYKADEAAWTTGITLSAAGSSGAENTISTDSSTVEFRRLQLRVRMEYTGAAPGDYGPGPTTAPVVTGVEARAAVASKVRVFRYLLDLNDDHSSAKQSLSGASKADLFLASAAKTVVLDLKDGYTDRRAGHYDQYDVVVDSYNVVLDRPGEGLAEVTLREVV